MIRLLGWSIRDYLTFSDTEIKLADEHGLYVVSGDNRDSTISENTNAVGKSRLFSCIATALFENDPMSLDKRNRKQVLKAKTSSTSVELVPHSGVAHQITQTPSKIFISKANKKGEYEDQKAIKLEVARNNIAQLFPMSEKMFYATCYIQAQRPCDFQRAKPRERLAFITELFNLDIYDKIRKEFSRRLSELAKAGIEYKTLADELADTQRRLTELDFKEDSAKIKKLKAKIAEVQSELSKLYEEKGSIDSKIEAAKTKAEIEEKRKKLSAELKELCGESVATEELISTYAKALKAANRYAEYRRELSKYNERLANAESKIASLPKLPKGIDSKEVSKRLKKALSKVSSLSDEFEAAESAALEYDAQMKKYKKLIGQLKESATAVEATSLYKELKLGKMESTSKIMAAVRPVIEMANVTVALSESLEDVDDHIDSCPICSSKVSFDSIKSTVKKAKRYLKEFDLIERHIELTDQFCKKPEKPTVDPKEIERQLIQAEEEVTKLTKHQKLFSQHEAYVTALEELKADKPKKQSKPEFDKDTCESVLHVANRLRAIQESLGDKVVIDVAKLVKQRKQLKDSIDTLTEALRPAEEKKRKYEVAKSNFELLIAQRDKLTAKLKSIGPELEKQKLYKGLVDAYSPNKLKLQDAEKILSWLEDSLNRYSHLVFLEPMKFQIRTQKDGISAMAIRNNGESSDISQLSGAETNCFRLLLALSLIPLLPENKRTNFLILDEPDNNSSDAVRSHLIREFLPKLRAVVPHVFWITPKSVDEFDDYRLIKVIKHGGISEVEIVSNED